MIKLIKRESRGGGGKETTLLYELRDFAKETPIIATFVRKHKLILGCYIQEFAVDSAAINLIIKHINNNPQIFQMGLSWGGLNGEHTQCTANPFSKNDGMWSQRYIGSSWKKLAK